MPKKKDILEEIQKLGVPGFYLTDNDNMVIEVTSKITRDQIKKIEAITGMCFSEISVRESPAMNYQTIVELFFVR